MTPILRARSGVAFGAALLLTMPSWVQAQEQPKSVVGTSYVSVFAGGAGTNAVAPAAGMNLGVEFTRRLNFEGRARWFDAPAGDNAFSADFGIRYMVARSTFTRPYVSGGVGVFESYFSHVSETTPSFYRQRMDPIEGAHGFHDMLWTVGGGADLFVTRHVSLRPEVTFLIASTRHDARLVPQYGISLAYFFDSHTSFSR
jgi:hypothetical protein